MQTKYTQNIPDLCVNRKSKRKLVHVLFDTAEEIHGSLDETLHKIINRYVHDIEIYEVLTHRPLQALHRNYHIIFIAYEILVCRLQKLHNFRLSSLATK